MSRFHKRAPPGHSERDENDSPTCEGEPRPDSTETHDLSLTGEHIRHKRGTRAARSVTRAHTCASEVARTQVVVEKVEEHQHAAAHDHEHGDHDGGDVNGLLVLLLRSLVPLELQVASRGDSEACKMLFGNAL